MSSIRKQFSKQYGGKLGNSIMYKVRVHICHYQQYKKITAIQSKDYAEDTDRYNSAMKWYELIRSTLEEWRSMYPNDAAAVADLYGLGDRVKQMSVNEVCMKHYYSTSTLYSVRHNFDLEIAFKAVKLGLIDIM